MNDKEFLQWIHDRLLYQLGDDYDVLHLHKLRGIISNYSEDKITKPI